MARMRTLKPEFWTDEVIVELTPYARLFYQGCWNFAICDRGHLDDSPKSLKLKILPADNVDPVELIDELLKFGRLVRKQMPDGRTYLHLPTLDKHSKADTRWSTRCQYCASEGYTKPVSAPPAQDELAQTQESVPESAETQEKSPRRGRGSSKGEGVVKEGKGIKNVARARATRIPDDNSPSEPGTLEAFPAIWPDGQVADLESPANAGPGSLGTPKVPRPSGKPKSSGIKATRIPDDFAVTAAMVAWAAENAPNVNGRRETEKFVNYWRGKAGASATKLDWPATWRNWMLTAQTDAERNGSRASPGSVVALRAHQPPRNGTDAKVAEWLAIEPPAGYQEAQ